MNEWRAYHIYYSDVDRLIIDCVHPFFQHWEDRIERRSWERHYAGGPHLRIRLRGSVAELAHAGNELAAWVGSFLARYPSQDVGNYSAERAAKLLEWEG